jgi:hypothetical protein
MAGGAVGPVVAMQCGVLAVTRSPAAVSQEVTAVTCAGVAPKRDWNWAGVR